MLDQNVFNLLSTLIGAIAALAGGFIVTSRTQRSEKRKLAREKCQEIFELFIQVKRWINNEIDKWQERTDPNILNPPVSKNLECPIDRLLMLVILYAPILEKMANELNRWVESYHTFEWNLYNDGNNPSDDMPDFLREEWKKLDDFEQRFTTEIKKFVEKN